MDKLFIEAVKSIYGFTDEEVLIYLKNFRQETIDQKTEEFKIVVKNAWYNKK